ncbi:hypothetical protein [Variovorax sp. tm]|uniref:hypothetical protein n=1 Tax=Variovorax atrisoli TaxID=3394203 RepID=UPI003A80CD56
MTTVQAPAQAVEVCFRTKGTRRQAFVRPQGSRQWQGWSVPRADVAIKRGSITIPGLVDAPVVVRDSMED